MSENKIKISYDSDYVCKYKNIDEINKYKNISKTKNNDIDIDIDIESELYRMDLLNIFKIDSYNDNNIIKTIDQIYDLFIQNNEIKENEIHNFRKILFKASRLFMSTDEKFGLTVLFSFEYLFDTHNCISELLKTNNINKKTLHNLEKCCN